MGFADDYVSVNDRIEKFVAKYPDGRIQTEIVKHTDTIVIMRASVYRDPDDPRPSVAHSQLGIPGRTNFTRDSEVENAETSAVGRALAFMGFETKKGLASREEVQSRRWEPPHDDPRHETQQPPQQQTARHAEGTSNWKLLTDYMQASRLRRADVEPVMGGFTPDVLDAYMASHDITDPIVIIDGILNGSRRQADMAGRA